VYYSYMTTLVAPGAVGSATAGCQLTLNAGALVAPPVFGLLADGVDYGTGWTFLAVTCLLAALLVAAVIRSPPPRAVTA
jgi:sugar phosphate permease